MKKVFKIYIALFLIIITCIEKPISIQAAISNNEEFTNFDYISEPMTYEEMINRYAQSGGCSYEEALHNFPKAKAVNPRATYRELTVTLNVASTYKPKIAFYCETSESSQYWGILSIYSIQLIRSYNGTSKQFMGDIEAWLRSAYKIEYVINGDFYNNGTTTVTGTVGSDAGIDEKIKISLGASITTSSNHFKYFYKHETKSFQ